MSVYWLEQRLTDLPADDSWLTAGESARLASLRVPKRRADWRLGRWTVKGAVSAYLERLVPHTCKTHVGYSDIEVRPAASGAPEVLLFHRSAPLTISLTHSQGVAICAVAASGVALGCDLEVVEARSAAFLADYFTPEEQALVEQTSAEGRDRITTLLWSAKESALKATRTGLRVDTRDLTVTALQPGIHDVWSPLQVRCASGELFHGWWRERNGFVLTLVAAPAPSLPVELSTAINAGADTR